MVPCLLCCSFVNKKQKKGDEITMFMIGFVHFVSYMDLNPF